MIREAQMRLIVIPEAQIRQVVVLIWRHDLVGIGVDETEHCGERLVRQVLGARVAEAG